MMKVSKPTLDTFKNFATINTNLLVREGKRFLRYQIL